MSQGPKRRSGESEEDHAARVEAAKDRNRQQSLKRWHEDPEYRARQNSRQREQRKDPDYLARERERNRNRKRNRKGRDKVKRRLKEIEACGNPETCQCCGGEFVGHKINPDGRCVDHRHDNGLIRGVVCTACNRNIAVMDLRLSDPDYFRKLMEWSDRHAATAPVEPVRSVRDRKLHGPILEGVEVKQK